jgi:hypothetical protein
MNYICAYYINACMHRHIYSFVKEKIIYAMFCKIEAPRGDSFILGGSEQQPYSQILEGRHFQRYLFHAVEK